LKLGDLGDDCNAGGNLFQQGLMVGALLEQLRVTKAALAAKEEDDMMQKVLKTFAGK
jgi:hypothetical protein